MRNLLERDFWSQKWVKFKNYCIFVKYIVVWFIFNYIMSLIPVIIVFIIDYRANSNNLYRDTTFLGVMSFSFTLLVTGGYSLIVWEKVKLLAGSLTILCLFAISFLSSLYYSALPDFTEGSFPKFVSDNKFCVTNTLLVLALAFGVYLNWATIEKCHSNEVDRKERERQEKLKSKDEYKELKAKLIL